MDVLTFAVLAIPVLLVAVALMVIVARYPRHNASGSRCGDCGCYLTKATSDHCPECGELFVAAGVVNHTRRRGGPMVTIAITAAMFLAYVGLVFGYFAFRANRMSLPIPAAAKTPSSATALATQPVDQTQEELP